MKIFRRIILFLLIIISVLWIEVAHADMSAPELREIEVVVINPDGINYNDYKGEVAGHLNKDDTVLIMYEYDGKYTLGSVEKTMYGGHSTLGYVESLDGFSIVQDEVDPTKLTNDETITVHDKVQKAKVNSSEGVDVYSGPASLYKKVGHIKDGTILTYKYSTQGTHIYVEYNGIKGWVEILEGKVLITNDTQYIFSKDVSTECGTIPRNSITTPTYKTDRWSHKAAFEYNGCTFYHNTLKDEEVLAFYPYNRPVSREVTLYEYADNSSTVLKVVPEGAKITVLAATEYYYGEKTIIYAEYDGVRGWVFEDGEVFDFSSNIDELEKDPVIKDTIVNEEKEEEKVPQYEEKPIINMPELIILCSMGGVLLVLTAVVIIILVNKNKKAKVVTQTEIQKEEK